MDHEISMRNLDNALKQFTRADGKTKRQAMWSVVVNLNIGAFIRKATRNGGDKTMSTYFTYNGSLNDGKINLFYFDNVTIFNIYYAIVFKYKYLQVFCSF